MLLAISGGELAILFRLYSYEMTRQTGSHVRLTTIHRAGSMHRPVVIRLAPHPQRPLPGWVTAVASVAQLANDDWLAVTSFEI